MTEKFEDLRDDRIPQCLQWTDQQVADWVEELGFPFYRDCFLTNFINGRKLILMDGNKLPQLGITDYQHIKKISDGLQELLTIEKQDWSRSISLPPKELLGSYLEMKRVTGERADDLIFKRFEENYPELKWQPPLANHCLIMPRN